MKTCRYTGHARKTAILSVIGTLLCTTCSSREEVHGNPPSPPQERLRSLAFAQPILEFAEAHPAVREANGHRIQPYIKHTGMAMGHWSAGYRPIEASVPSAAEEPMRLLTTGAGELAIRRIGASSAAGKLVRGAVVFASAASGYEAVMVAGQYSIHDFLLPKESGVALGYEVQLPPGWMLHSVGSSARLIEIRDNGGFARLRFMLRGGLDVSGKEALVRAEIAGSSIAIAGSASDLAVVHAEWEGTSAPAFNREWTVATLLRTGKVLVTGKLPNVSLGTEHAGELYDPISSTFTATAEFISFAGKAVVQLPTGDAVAFGKADDQITAANEITFYNPDSDRSVDTIKPSREFFPERALVLPDETVLICGRDRSAASSDGPTAWILSNKTVNPIEASRQIHLAGTPVLLPSGKVAVIGRGGKRAMYDPRTRSVSGDSVDVPASVVPLSDGSVLILNENSVATVLEPESGARKSIPTPAQRKDSAGIRLASGKVLVVDGGSGQSSAASYVFDPSSDSFSDAKELRGTGTYAMPVLAYLPGGGVLMLATEHAESPAATMKAPPQVYRPAWETQAIRSLHVPRHMHTVTMLSPEKVLIAGGDVAGTAELYDLEKRNSRIVAKLNHPRKGHTATLLLSGQVLLVGGNSESPDAELFDPTTATFKPVRRATPLPIYQGHQATTLSSGRVLITGGTYSPNSGASPDHSLAEIYDPESKQFQKTASMVYGRAGHAATLLQDGNVLIVGGAQNRLQDEFHAELFDAKQEKFLAIGPTRDERYGASSARLRSGKVLVARATTDGTLELFDPVTNTFSPSGKPTYAYASIRVLALSSGKTVLLGTNSPNCNGYPCEEGEIYDEASGRFILAPHSWYRNMEQYTATPLAGDRLLMSGGTPGTAGAARIIVHDFGAGQRLTKESSPALCSDSTLTALPDGKVLRLGAPTRDSECSPSLLDFGPDGGENQVGLRVQNWHRSILLSSGKAFIVGANTNLEPNDNAVLFDPADSKMESWRLKYGWEWRVPTMMSDGRRVLLIGGKDYANQPIVTAEVFDPAKSSSPFDDIGTTQGRTPPSSVLLGTGDVLVAGPGSETLEVFDRASQKFLDTKTRGVQQNTKAAVRLASGDALLLGSTASFLFHASTRSVEYGIGLPSGVTSGIALLGGDVIAATSLELLRVTPGRNVLSEPYPISADGTFAPLRSGGVVFGGPSQLLVISPVPDRARRPVLKSPPSAIVSGESTTIEGSGFRSCTAVDCKLGLGSALGPPTVAFLPLDGGGPLFSSVMNWTDTRLEWRVPSSAYHGMGWIYVIVDGVPSEGTSSRLVGIPPKGACVNGAECASGFCIGGICCEQQCGFCESCLAKEKQSGKDDGVCGPAKVGEDPQNACERESSESCGFNGACDGKGRCAKHPNGTPCRSNGHCNDGVCSSCDGDQWAVNGSTRQNCEPFRCSLGVCAAECSSDSACLPGYACDVGTHKCGPYCSADYRAAIRGTTTTPCDPYRCISGACATKCISNVECDTGYMCNLNKECELYVPMSLPDQSCSVRRVRRNAGLWHVIGALSAGLWCRRRIGRRASASRARV